MPFDPAKQANGALFKNERKKNDKAPDYTGMVEITPEFWAMIQEKMGTGSVKLDLAGWVREKQSDGSKFISMSIRPPFKPDNSRLSPRKSSDVPF